MASTLYLLVVLALIGLTIWKGRRLFCNGAVFGVSVVAGAHAAHDHVWSTALLFLLCGLVWAYTELKESPV